MKTEAEIGGLQLPGQKCHGLLGAIRSKERGVEQNLAQSLETEPTP